MVVERWRGLERWVNGLREREDSMRLDLLLFSLLKIVQFDVLNK